MILKQVAVLNSIVASHLYTYFILLGLQTRINNLSWQGTLHIENDVLVLEE